MYKSIQERSKINERLERDNKNVKMIDIPRKECILTIAVLATNDYQDFYHFILQKD